MTNQNTDFLLVYTQWMKINKILPAEFYFPFMCSFLISDMEKNFNGPMFIKFQ